MDTHSPTSQAEASTDDHGPSTFSYVKESLGYWKPSTTASVGTIANDKLRKDVSLLNKRLQAIQAYVSHTPITPKDTMYNLEHSIQQVKSILQNLDNEIYAVPIDNQINGQNNLALDKCS